MAHRVAALLLVGWLALVAPAAAGAAEVRFPLTVEYDLLQKALRRHLREQSGGELVVWRSDDGCRTFALRDPTIRPVEGRLLVAGPASARVALGLFGYCFAQLGWDGHVEVLAQPEIGADWQLRLHVVDTTLYDADRQRSGVASRVWDTVKGWAQAALPSFGYDVGPPVQELRTALARFGAPRGPLAAALQTLRPVGVGVEPDGLKVALALDVPSTPPAARGPEPALTPAQVRQWEATLERWDGFLTFVVKDVGNATGDTAARDELLDVLVSARHDLVAVLGRGPEPGPDPVQRLFVDVWSRLRTLVRRAATQPGDEVRAIRYLTFLAAGDALTALTGVGPALGVEISADGLRRLARMLDPVYAGDPLEYSELPDASLRQLFRFRDPDAPPRRQRRRAPGSMWEWLAPRAAHADEADEWAQLGRRLDRWVPATDELGAYRGAVGRLLELAAERTFDPGDAGGASDLERFEGLFRHLVQAVAWQESCWRQFVRQGGSVTYLLSPTQDVGIMQINVRVWRGFFNVEKLRWSAPYNAGAGAEILYNLLGRYGAREGRERLENAARATYSAYNGGPARYRRYRLGNRVPAIWRAVDRGFWEKYQLVAAGRAEGRVLCMPGA
jgi:hypothetical protein